jgi:hypothetical protein
MDYVAFVPKYHEVPDQLVAVLVPSGMVTREIWEEALALRIESLALSEESPEQASIVACRFLDCPVTEDPRELPVKIFRTNALFKAQLKVRGIGEEHFPVYVDQNDKAALDILENDSLDMWVASAYSFIDINREALLAYTSGNFYNKREYEQIVPHIIDLEIRPYADFVKEKINAYIDYQSTDADEFTVLLTSYDFKFSISHHHDCVRLGISQSLRDKKEDIDVKKLENDVSIFNRDHASKVHFWHIESKKFFNKTYELEHFFFDLEFPLGTTVKEIERTFFTFFEDLRDLLTDERFSITNPAYLGIGAKKKSFVEYLESEMSFKTTPHQQ